MGNENNYLGGLRLAKVGPQQSLVSFPDPHWQGRVLVRNGLAGFADMFIGESRLPERPEGGMTG